LKLEELQVEIKARTAAEAMAIAARMVQHRPGPILTAWGFYSVFTAALGYVGLFVLELHPAWVLTLVPLCAPIFSLPLIATVGHLVFSPKVSFGTVARATLRRGAHFFVLFIANRILTLVGLSLLVVPGLYLWRSSWFLGPIVLLEGSPLSASFRRGRRFAIGFHGRVAGHAFNVAVLLGYMTLAFGSLIHFLSVNVFGLTFTTLTELPLVDGYYPFLAVIGFALAVPFATVVWFFVYLDVRIRKEGWDLEIAFRSRAAIMERSHART
jgi:hypothetical protein